MNQGGFALQVPRPELYYELLPVHQVKIHADRGVKIGGLWYGRAGPVLKPYEGKRSARGGQRKGEWVIRSDRRDRRQVFFQDPADPAAWHALRWNGLPSEGEIPAFSDKTAEELLDRARAAGLSPQSDDDLLPVLLKLLGGVAPVSKWPSQLGKKEKRSGPPSWERRRRRAGPARPPRVTRRPGTGRDGDPPEPAATGRWFPSAGRSRRPGPATWSTPSAGAAASRPSRSGPTRPGRSATSCAPPACWHFPMRTR
jgi:hypothetical protein